MSTGNKIVLLFTIAASLAALAVIQSNVSRLALIATVSRFSSIPC